MLLGATYPLMRAQSLASAGRVAYAPSLVTKSYAVLASEAIPARVAAFASLYRNGNFRDRFSNASWLQ